MLQEKLQPIVWESLDENIRAKQVTDFVIEWFPKIKQDFVLYVASCQGLIIRRLVDEGDSDSLRYTKIMKHRTDDKH